MPLAPGVAGATKDRSTRTRPRAAGMARSPSATARTGRPGGGTRSPAVRGAEVAEKLKQLQAERDSGVQPELAYTVQRAADDWLAEGLDGRSARTVRLNHDVLNLITTVIGGIELRLLTAHDVRRALVHVAASNSSRTVTLAHNALTRSLRHAEA